MPNLPTLSVGEQPVTQRQREAGVWSIRHSVARRDHWCIECGRLICPPETYWRRYGKMAEAFTPFVAVMCEACEANWRRRYGEST